MAAQHPKHSNNLCQYSFQMFEIIDVFKNGKNPMIYCSIPLWPEYNFILEAFNDYFFGL